MRTGTRWTQGDLLFPLLPGCSFHCWELRRQQSLVMSVHVECGFRTKDRTQGGCGNGRRG